MRRILILGAALLALFSPAAHAANSTVTAMTAASAFGGTELLYVVQGAADRKGTPAQMATYVYSLASGDCTITSGGAVSCTKFNGGTAFGSAAGAATGTSGATLPFLNGTNTFSGTQTFGSVFGTVSTQSGTTYTLAASDCGTEIAFTNAAAVTVTIPAALTTGCNISILQTTAAGQVTVTGTAVAAATLHSAHSYTKTFGQWAVIGINIYTTGVAILTGDGA